MGIFSFLKKKNDATGDATEGIAHPATPAVSAGTRPAPQTNAERERQREIARATAAKIDEIELEMASAIFDDDAWDGGRRSSGHGVQSPAAMPAMADADVPELTDILDDFAGSGPESSLGSSPDAAASPSTSPAVEEAAILYANGQADAAEQVLLASLAEAGAQQRLPWRMLLDLYQLSGREEAFENIAIDFASRFETSPPAYQPRAGWSADLPAAQAFAGATPTASLVGHLDQHVASALARVLAPSPSPIVRIEFSGVTGVTAPACALLHEVLQQVRRGGRELVLAGADGMMAVLRPMLTVGARNASPAPWLLLLELLLLTDREKAFEETAMDYCITFEVSPPSFERPAHAALSLAAGPAVGGDRFLLPAVVEGDCAALLAALDAHAARHPDLVLDCSRLARIDYAAANALGARLRTLAQDGRRIELRDLNHLAAALLRLLGVDAHAVLATPR